jgi:probable HAF family extracellular repeat protein
MNGNRLLSVKYAWCLVALVGLSSRVWAQQYTITDLGPCIYTVSINNAGQVVGTRPTYSAFEWTSGSSSNVGTLGSTSFGNDINSSGQVVGYSYNGSYLDAYICTNGVMTDLGRISTTSYANAVNDAGIAVGTSDTSPGVYYHAVVWQNGVLTDLGPQIGSARDINNSNLIVGSYNGGAFKLQLGGTVQMLPGLPDETNCQANAVNDNGWIVGYSQYNGGPSISHAVLWTGAGIQDLGALGGPSQSSEAFGINGQGLIVGGSNGHAFIYDATNGMRDLNSLVSSAPGWVLTEADSINDSGAIVGVGTIGGETHAFLVTPVPEPACAGLLWGGALVLSSRRLRRGKNNKA